MKKVKVLHLLPPGFGGIDAYVFSHYKYMDRDKFHFDFLTRNPELEGAAQYKGFSYNVKLLPSTAAKDKEGFTQCVTKVLSEGYDVFHIHTSYWTGFLLEKLARDAGIKKVILHSHSSFVDEPDDARREILLKRHEEIKREFPAGLADEFWACSKKAADWLFGPQIPKEKITILKNAIELERYKFSPQIRASVRASIGLENTFVIGTVGRMCYQKNHDFLLSAFARYHMKHKNSMLVIVGDGELRAELELKITNLQLKGNVLLTGWKENVGDYLQAMDVFTLPSRFEGLPISALEAAASGLPCIVSNCVSDELAYTERIKRLPLEITTWVSALDNTSELHIDREDGVEEARAAGYDVRQQAKVLEAMYIN